MTDMDVPHRLHFNDPAPSERCAADCSNCTSFPASVRRIGDAAYCRFSPLNLRANQSMIFAADRKIRLLFVLAGTLELSRGAQSKRLDPMHCVCLGRGESFAATARTDLRAVVLALDHRIEFNEEKLFDDPSSSPTIAPHDVLPTLPIRREMELVLNTLFTVRALNECERYHKMKAAELFMMLQVLHSPSEHAYFFQSVVRPQNNFRVFVCSNYDRARSVNELASLAGMSLSVFKRRFAEHFHDSVYHWMMRQKALRIQADIRDGADNTKALMAKYGFRHYTQFSRFCKNYLEATPAQMIASARKR